MPGAVTGRALGRRLERFERHFRLLAGPPANDSVNPLQLGNRDAQRDDNKTADRRRGSGDDEGIAKAEFIDRNAVSDHRDADHDGNGADDVQQNRHERYDPLLHPPDSSLGTR